MSFNAIQADYEAYLADVAAGVAGVDVEVPALLCRLAALEQEGLAFLGQITSFDHLPAAVAVPAPFLVHLPVNPGIAAQPFSFGEDIGYPGGEVAHQVHSDIFIAGGQTTDDYAACQVRALGLYLPLCYLYAKNSTLDGACHGLRITGASWEELPIGDTIYTGLAVHSVATLYYLLPAA